MEAQIQQILDNMHMSNAEKCTKLRELFVDNDLSESYSYNKAKGMVNPDFKQRWYASMQKYFRNRYHDDDEFRKRIVKFINTYQRRRYHSDEEYREKMKQYSRDRYHSDLEYKERKRQQMRAKYVPQNPDRQIKATIVIGPDGKKKYIYSKKKPVEMEAPIANFEGTDYGADKNWFDFT